MTDIPDEWRNIVAAEIAEHDWQPLTVRYAIADAALAKLELLITAYVANQIADAIEAKMPDPSAASMLTNSRARGMKQAAVVAREFARGWSP